MSTEPLIGSIEWVAFNFAPRGWALCNGQIMSISQNTALFSLLGTMYGGNGINTFALPDLRGRTPIGVGVRSGGGDFVTQGETMGMETVPLTSNTMPMHVHTRVAAVSEARASSGAVTGSGAVLGGGSRAFVDAPLATRSLAPSAFPLVGGSQPHTNMQPYLTLNAIIATQGVFPSRN